VLTRRVTGVQLAYDIKSAEIKFRKGVIFMKIEIFDPAMCCSTGVCGPSIDPELMRMATVINVI
jgi:hypothetical protein